jgi:hypothetical protein
LLLTKVSNEIVTIRAVAGRMAVMTWEGLDSSSVLRLIDEDCRSVRWFPKG